MDNTLKLCMNLIKSQICLTPLDLLAYQTLSEEEVKKIYAYSKAHDVVHIVGNALIKNNLVAGKLKEAFNKQVVMAVFRYQKLNYELEEIKSILTKNNISFIPLKGSVIRELYKEPWMRTSCDIDILLRKEDIKKAIKVCGDVLGNTNNSKSGHDEVLTTDSGNNIEFHYDLIEDYRLEKVDLPLKEVWDYAEAKNNTSEYVLKDEMFYYYHIAHMAKHLSEGGCGIRPFIDLYLLNQNKNNTENRNKLLESGNLNKFAKECNSIVDCFFNDKPFSDIDEDFISYVLDGGVYGSTGNRTAIKSTTYKNKFTYTLSRIWMPYEQLSCKYPSLKGKRILQPIYEVRRWLWIIFSGRINQGAKEIKINTTLDENKIEKTKKLFENIGISIKSKKKK